MGPEGKVATLFPVSLSLTVDLKWITPERKNILKTVNRMFLSFPNFSTISRLVVISF